MRLVGWNEIPDGYGTWFDISRAPLWLRLWFRTPILDKFARPVAVRRGFGYLTPEPGLAAEQLGDVGPGWQIAPSEPVNPDVVAPYHSINHPGALRRRRRRYTRAAWRHRVGRVLMPPRIQLPGGLLVERHNYLFWRIRLPLWAVCGAAGILLAGWPGVTVALPIAVVVELLCSYRRPHGTTGIASSAIPD